MAQTQSHRFPLIEVSGTSYEMGYQHGAQVKELVHKYLLWIDKLTGKPRDVLCRNALRFLPQLEALSPALVEEIKGLAEGAGISFEEALLCQARAEAAQDGPDEGCSAFALTGEATADGHALAGQNQDLQPEYSDVAILLHLKPTDGRPRVLLFTSAGQLGYAGMNSAGMAHFANALYNCPWRQGLPHYPLKRVALEQTTFDGIRKVITENPTCSAGNMVMCDGQDGILDVEIRADGVAEFADDRPDAILHTNHYLASEFQEHEDGHLKDSFARLERIRKLVHARYGEITVDVMKEILADHEGDPAGICRHGERGMHSVSGYIAEPAQGVLHVRRGHGCTGTWKAYEV